MNQIFVDLITTSNILSLVTTPSLALTVFRLVPEIASSQAESLPLESLNDLNRIFFGRISARHDILLTQTSLNGIFCIRLAVGAARTGEKHIKQAYEILCKEAEWALENWEQSVVPQRVT